MQKENFCFERHTIILTCLTILLSFPDATFGQRFMLEIKPYAKIVGPYITLNEICTLKPKSETLQQKIALIKLGKAAPPSESKDLSLSYIRLQLRRAGLLEYIDTLKGPRIIRVKTAHKDITRLRIKEAVVQNVEKVFKLQNLNIENHFTQITFDKIVKKGEKKVRKSRIRTIKVVETTNNAQILTKAQCISYLCRRILTSGKMENTVYFV